MSNLANSYAALGRHESALRIEREVYAERMKLNGEEHRETLAAANNYAASLINLERYVEAKSLLRKTIPVERRILGDNDRLAFQMRKAYAQALYKDDGATVDDLREAVTTLEEIEPIARRVFGGAHPMTRGIEGNLQVVRDALRAREQPSDEEQDSQSK